MSELLPSDENENTSEHDFESRFGPESALPTTLHSVSYAKDIWQRVKNHPVSVPAIRRDEISKNSDTRELIHAMLAAAESREKEILLHNQARVFAEVLNRVVSSVGRFLNEPVVALGTQATPERIVEVATVVDEAATPQARRTWASSLINKSNGKAVLQWALTPKYVLLAIVTLLGLVTGYSQYQRQQLKATIADLQAGNDIANKLKASLVELKGGYEKRASDYALEIQKVNETKLSLEEKLRKQERDIGRLTVEISQANTKIKAEKITESELQKAADTASKELAFLKEKAKQLEIQLADSQATKKASISAMRSMEKQFAATESRCVSLASENADLLKYRNGFSVIKTALQTIENEANHYYPSIDSIRNAISLNNDTLGRIMR